MMKRLSLYASLLCLLACKSPASEQKKTLQEFDTIDQRLKRLNELVDPVADVLYDSVAVRYGELFLDQFRSRVTEAKKYVEALKGAFVEKCGGVPPSLIPEESYTNLSLAAQFFMEEKHGEELYYKLQDLTKTFSAYNDDPLLDARIQQMIYSTKGEGQRHLLKPILKVCRR